MERVDRTAAVGRRLAHDVTEVIAGERKRVYLRRGDTVTAEHLDTLANMGKEHLVVLAPDEALDGAADDGMHENDAAALLAAAAAGPGVESASPVEGKCDLRAACDGLFLAEVAAVDALNRSLAGQAAIITRTAGVPVRAGERLGLARIFPARVAGETPRHLAAAPSALSVHAFRPHRAGVVVTGAEVLAGRVQDGFGPLIRSKLEAYGSTVGGVRIVGDDPEAIARALREMAAAGHDLLFATGGMAVDADDVTQAAIRRAGVAVRFAGVPMQPATLLLFGTLDGVPLFGVPAGVLYDAYSALDRLLPYVLAGRLPTAEEVLGMGVGGMLGGGHRQHAQAAATDGAAARHHGG